MALSKTISLTDNFGESITFVDAYVKVAQASATKDTCVVTYKILRSQGGQELEQRFADFSLDLEGLNPIKQAYLHLKTLPEFSDATDC
jgi:hypothetical protein